MTPEEYKVKKDLLNQMIKEARLDILFIRSENLHKRKILDIAFYKEMIKELQIWKDIIKEDYKSGL